MSDLKQSPAAFLHDRNGDHTKEPALNQPNPSRKPTGPLLRRAFMTLGRE